MIRGRITTDHVGLPAVLLGSLVVSSCIINSGSSDSAKLTPGIFLDDSLVRSEPDTRAPLRRISTSGIELTKESEGFEPRPYDDAARYCTIAYGHLIKRARCDKTEPPHWWNPGLAVPEGTSLLVEDMKLAQAALDALTSVELTDDQYAALCDFVYNVGRTNYASSTLRAKVNAGDFRDIPYQMRRWTQAKGKVLPGLVARREREIRLFFVDTEGASKVLRSDTAAPVRGELIDIRIGERK
jgi:GH24 family phage-related lysozyme (muramidase)